MKDLGRILTSEEKDAIYYCLRYCLGVYDTTGVIPLIDITKVEDILELKR